MSKKLLGGGSDAQSCSFGQKTSLITNVITNIHKRKPVCHKLLEKLPGVMLKVAVLIKKQVQLPTLLLLST
jgi:hypothetical protein